MADRPILFSGPMVRALLDGRKTQTRRVMKPQPEPFDAMFSDAGRWWTGDAVTGEVHQVLRVPYATGDRLWVREAWADIANDPHCDLHQSGIQHAYRSTDDDEFTIPPRWRTSIHMPRAVSRLTLIVTDVRVQRLHDISEADAVAEGVDAVTMSDVPRQASLSRRSDFAALWYIIHGPGAWDANPWVCALTFTVAHGNIDQLPAPCPPS